MPEAPIWVLRPPQHSSSGSRDDVPIEVSDCEPESETGPSRAYPVELGDRRGGRLFISMAKPSESGVGGILGSNRRLEKLSALCFLYVVIHNIPRTVLHGLICVDVHCCYAKLAKQDRHHNHEHKPQNYLDQGHPISSGGSKTRDFVLG